MVDVTWWIERKDEIEFDALVSRTEYTNFGTFHEVKLTFSCNELDASKITALIRKATLIKMRWNATSARTK